MVRSPWPGAAAPPPVPAATPRLAMRPERPGLAARSSPHHQPWVSAMPLTPDEALSRNAGRANLQMERAIRALLDEVELALEDYVGDHLYVGLPSYLEYRTEFDAALGRKPTTLEIVDERLHERFAAFGWKIGIVTNSTGTHHWIHLLDARER
ncbi:hypothetical protein TA3x_002362 [Tundrisphaera sp. TA3]|uniref:hypothetical protein n=1 Tax=Tundrisphaera sp. TA3 TaxID=3435775 RepID=UPI003EB805EB